MLQKPANLPVLWDNFLKTLDAFCCLVVRHWSLILINAGTWNCIGNKRDYLTSLVHFFSPCFKKNTSLFTSSFPLSAHLSGLSFPKVPVFTSLPPSQPSKHPQHGGSKQAGLGNEGGSVNIQPTYSLAEGPQSKPATPVLLSTLHLLHLQSAIMKSSDFSQSTRGSLRYPSNPRLSVHLPTSTNYWTVSSCNIKSRYHEKKSGKESYN